MEASGISLVVIISKQSLLIYTTDEQSCYKNPTKPQPKMQNSLIKDPELQNKKSFLNKLLSILQEDVGTPCEQCFGPDAECVCLQQEKCKQCDGPEDLCVCVYGGRRRPSECPCNICTECSSRALKNKRDVTDFMDSVIYMRPSPSHPEIIDALIRTLQNKNRQRSHIDTVRAITARRMFGRLMKKVHALLQMIKHLNCEDDDDWNSIFILIQDIRGIFVRNRAPAGFMHRDFGRLCGAMCDSLVIHEPSAWLAVTPCKRKQTLCSLYESVGRSLAEIDVSFLGKWGQMQVAKVVNK
jgi:hypothetical protein